MLLQGSSKSIYMATEVEFMFINKVGYGFDEIKGPIPLLSESPHFYLILNSQCNRGEFKKKKKGKW
jgi:hypothetical protein